MLQPSDLFSTTLDESRLHPAYRALRDSPVHADARSLMNALYLRMRDPNGNFPYDFCTDGFHSRLFELACFAYLEGARFAVDRSYDKPDFLASREGVDLAVEAATANPSGGRATDISVLRIDPISEKEILNKVSVEFPRRMTAVLEKKLKHRYHELSHCAGKPLVVMLAPFFEPGSVFYTDEALVGCLYGCGNEVTHSQTVTPFFVRRTAGSISAVLYCNGFTVPRFFRLATKLDTSSRMIAIRSGTCYSNRTDTEFATGCFQYRVGDVSAPIETWSEGVTIFLNPNADIPLPAGVLPATSTFSIREGSLFRDVGDFHPVTSFTMVHVDTMG